ncbi:hypothetical protein SAMN02787144_1004373 [Streptomyces atratus]|uniref:Uncharacterized protein n=1 Tax=Streptomyces atratus TaxID=1893 RepID=A0A1K1YMH2_STRAR|nr:hypothetical protein SAMN02787144_1004373 [Streptomyces atratus]
MAAARDFPACGAWNVSTVTAGTGEALPGPAACGKSAVGSIATYIRVHPGQGKWAGWASEAAVVLHEPDGRHNRRWGKGRCFVDAFY